MTIFAMISIFLGLTAIGMFVALSLIVNGSTKNEKKEPTKT